jgi:hypothetical protein
MNKGVQTDIKATDKIFENVKKSIIQKGSKKLTCNHCGITTKYQTICGKCQSKLCIGC